MCGKQRLVVGSDLKRFMLHAPKLFPRAKIRTVAGVADSSTLADRILVLLNKTLERFVTTKEITALIGKPWREVSIAVLTPFFRRRIEVLGWKYVPVKGKVGKGKLGARFERFVPNQSEGALSAYMSGPTPLIA